MNACLRQHMLYSEKRPRDFIFRAIGELLRETSPVMVSRLTREAAIRARETAAAAGFDFANWETASRAVVNAMLLAGVLLKEDRTPVRWGVAAQAAEVSGLQEDFTDATEAFLLEFLIRKLGDVSTRDHTAIAHALFRQFDPGVPIEGLVDRVAFLMAQVAGRVVLNEDGTYSACEPAYA